MFSLIVGRGPEDMDGEGFHVLVTWIPAIPAGMTISMSFIVPTQRVTAIKLSRHVGMDCRHPDYMDVFNACHPWPWIPPILGGMTRVFVIFMAVTQSVGTI